MCIRIQKFPLVNLVDGKRKVLFNIPFDNINGKLSDQLNLSHYNILSKYSNLQFVVRNKLFDIPDYVKREIINNDIVSFDKLISIPCGMCSECIRSRALNWSFRILNESKYHDHSYCITFTYDDEFLPKNGSLVKDEISKFNKKLKTYLSRLGMKSDFRFFGCGEYGDKYKRPHYHVIYFGLDLWDLVFAAIKNGVIYFDSPFIRKLWNKGHISVSVLNERCATYVASYVNKKIGVVFDENKVRPFTLMSRRPGIGSQILEDAYFKEKIDKGDYSFFENGFKFKLGRYYADKLDLDLSSDFINPLVWHNDMSVEAISEQLFFDDIKNGKKIRGDLD